MTRKRFIKLAMSEGYDRNTATQVAANVIERYGNYDECYRHMMLALILGVFQSKRKGRIS